MLRIGGRAHDPGDEQRHLRRHLLGSPCVRHRRRRDRASPRSSASGSPLCAHVAPASRRSTKDVVSWRTRPRPQQARRAADDLIWQGNVQLLEHEQRALVQPHFDRLSCCVRPIRLDRLGNELRRARRAERGCVLHLVLRLLDHTRNPARRCGAQAWPRITRFDDRWCWLVTSVVPRFRRFDADTRLVDASLRRIFDEARPYASTPCIHPVIAQAAADRRREDPWWYRSAFSRPRNEAAGDN